MPFWYIIANPTAGSGLLEQKWPQIEAVLQDMGVSYTIKFTESKGHATRLAEDAILKGHRYLLGIGGDGTNHEIVNGIMQQNAVPSSEVTYALLPFGTGNDWARQYQLTNNIVQRVQALLEPKTALQDIGLVHYQTQEGKAAQRFFVNVAGMAYDGYVAHRMEQDGKKDSKIEYLMAVARYLFEYEVDTATIYFEDQVVKDQFYTINIGLCRYSGGGMQFVPQAIPNDGLFALTFARRLPRWEVLLQTYRFYNGTLLSHPKITGTQAGSLRVDGTIDLEADGEYLGTAPAEFSLLPQALKIVL